MFKLRFFGSIAAQRREFLQAKEYAYIALNPKVQVQLDGLKDLSTSEADRRERSRLWRGSFASVSPLIVQSIIWNSVMALAVLLGVVASRSILEEGNTLEWSLFLCVLIFLGECARNLISYFDGIRRAQIARGVQLHLMKVVNKKLVDIDPTLIGELSKGNLKTLISSDVEAVEDFITASVMTWVPTLMLLLVLTPAIYFVAGAIGLVGVAVALLQLPVSILLARLIERYRNRSQTQQDLLTTLIGEWVRNIRLVRFLGWQPSIARDIAHRMRRYTVESATGHFLNCVMYGISTSWWMMPLIVMLFSAHWLNIPLNLAEFFTSVWALTYLSNYIQHLPYSISLYASAAAGASRIKKLLSTPDLHRHIKVVGADLDREDRPVRLHLRKVSLVLEGREIIRGLSTTISLLEATAIVGEVGSGKSLLLELLIGERFPSAGNIEVEFASGLTADLWCEEVYRRLRSAIAYVPQQPFLSNASFHSNISLDEETARAEVIKAAQAAQLEEDVALFSRGYEEEVGETGINLSGGQKQRVSLARAFLSGRSIFVLDDPLSAVDRATERSLAEQIFSKRRGVILVSHRLDELQRCNRIIVLEAGRIIEDGLPHMLIAEPTSAFQSFLRALAAREEEAA